MKSFYVYLVKGPARNETHGRGTGEVVDPKARDGHTRGPRAAYDIARIFSVLNKAQAETDLPNARRARVHDHKRASAER